MPSVVNNPSIDIIDLPSECSSFIFYLFSIFSAGNPIFVTSTFFIHLGFLVNGRLYLLLKSSAHHTDLWNWTRNLVVSPHSPVGTTNI